MTKEYGIYEQGAIFTREDFDIVKTICNLADLYGITLPDKIKEELQSNDISNESFSYLCREFACKPWTNTLECLMYTQLSSVALYNILIENDKYKFQNEMVYTSIYSDIVGEFVFDDENRHPITIEDDCMMLCFHVPNVWNIHDTHIPTDKDMAVLQLQQVAKTFLKDDINWEERLGTLYASGVTS